MTSTPQLVFVIVTALLVASCGKPGEEAQSNSQPEGGDPSPIAADASTNDHGLRLNGADKWPMDAHTRAMFDKMTASFRDGGTDSGDSESIKAVGAKIRGEIDELIQGCTMTGEAHNQLHKYLMAYIPAVEKMAKEGTKAGAASVRELLELYPKYFH
jgi:hypothetical protein